MALSDYSTAAEKIAALKAAMMDPALVKTYDGNSITFSNDGFILFAEQNKSLTDLASHTTDMTTEEGPMQPTFAFSILAGENYSGDCMYIYDSDIVYANPITTYQNRLAEMLTNQTYRNYDELSVIPIGANGSLITYYNNGCLIRVDGAELMSFYQNNLGWNCNVPDPYNGVIPIPSGATLYLGSAGGVLPDPMIRLMNVPADW